MKNGHIYLSAVIFGLYCSFSLVCCCGKDIKTANEQSANTKPNRPSINFAEMPLYFIANKGQVSEKAKFYSKTSQYTLWLSKEGLVFDTFSIRNANEKLEEIRRDVSTLLFVNANPEPEIIPVEKTILKVNYFIGNDPSKWHNDIPTSLAVLYKDLYRDINLKIYGIERQIEYDWIIKPGGDPNTIAFTYKTEKETRIDDKGNLLIITDSGELIHKRPVAYQQIGDDRILVAAEYKQIGENNYGFSVDDYNKEYPLVIDPVVLVYSTYLGGSNDDQGYSIAVDNNGNVYVTGETISTDFPTKDQYQTVQAGKDTFISKIDTTRNGTASLIYSTYLGGMSSDESGLGIAADDSGNVYVTGWTQSWDFPTLNQYQTCGNDYDVFITRIDTTRSGEEGLIYSTCLDGWDGDKGYAIAVDDTDNVYVTGDTNGGFPTKNQYQTCEEGGIFVTRIDTNQSGVLSLIYSTCLGGSSFYEQGYGISADNNGNVYVTGVTESPDFPTLNSFQTYRGNLDAFVTKMDTTRKGIASLVYSTFLGGWSSDRGYGITADENGSVYVTGYTKSSDFPTKDQYQTYQRYADGFVTKIDTTKIGTASLIYSTCLGGANYDFGEGITVGVDGDVYVTGWTQSMDFPTLNQYQTYQGNLDAFVTRIDTTQSGNASLIYSSYLGGEDDDRGQGIAADNSNNVYVTGWTQSMDFPTKGQYQTNQGGKDAFITKLSFSQPGTFNLSVILDGNGVVTSVPEGIDCPGNCSETYDKNSFIALTAVPSQGASFGHWTGGGCSGTAICTVTMNEDLEVTATFGKEGVVSWLMLLLNEE